MTSFFRFFNRSSKETGRKKDRTSVRNRSLRLESLENRELLSASPTDPELLNALAELENGGELVSGETWNALAAQSEYISDIGLTKEQVFSLGSNPGANHIIYLDFNGHVTSSSTDWGKGFSTPTFDIDGDTGSFSREELALIYGIWQIVSEYFRPFNINVTTYDYGLDNLIKSSNDDTHYGVRVVIGGSKDWFSPNEYADGASLFQDFNAATGKDNPAYVFARTLYNDYFNSSTTYDRLLYAVKVAATVAREVGHTMGLQYEPRITGAQYVYQRGHQIGGTSLWWGSLMGSGYTHEHYIYQWSSGQQNAFSVITSNGFSLRGDEPDNTVISFEPDSLETSRSGVISTNGDSDRYKFKVAALDNYNISVSSGVRIPDVSTPRVSPLYFHVTLADEGGKIIFSRDVNLSTGTISFDATLKSGEYTLTITGTNYNASPGFGSYGSRGLYTIRMLRSFVPTPIPGYLRAIQHGPGAVRLSWVGDQSIETYHVYGKGGQHILSTRNTFAELTGLEVGNYSYYVTGESALGVESEPSDSVEINVVRIDPPGNFSVRQVGPGTLQLSWDAVSNVSKYHVYCKNSYNDWIYVGGTTETNMYPGIDDPEYMIPPATNLTLYGLPNGTYTYVVTGVGVYESDYSAEQTVVVGNVSVPILSSAAQTGHNEVSLSWYPVSGASGYNIYRIDESGNKSLIGSTSGTSIVLTDVNPGTYYYSVSSVSDAYESKESESKRVVVVDLVPPTGLTLTQTGVGLITLSWNSVDAASTYNVYRLDGSSRTLVRTTSGTTTPLSVPSDGTYTYVVTSAISNYESEPSPDQSITLRTGEAPSGLAVVQTGSGMVDLNWAPYAGASSYNIYRKFGDEAWVKVATVDGTSTTMSDLELGRYSFKITANAPHESEYSDVRVLTLEALFAPANFIVKQSGAGTATFTWNAVAGATAYRIYRLNSDSSWSEVETVSDTKFNLSGLEPGGYTFAISSIGKYESDRSSSKSVTILGVAAPATLSATQSGNGQVTLEWSRVPAAASYNVYRKNDDGSWTSVATVSGATTTTLSGLASGTYVFAVTANGTYESERSPEASVTVSGLSAPTGLNAVQTGADEVRISWNAVEGATSYYLYRRYGTSSWSRIDIVSGTSTTLSGLLTGEQSYAVSAVSEAESEKSAEKTIVVVRLDAPTEFTAVVSDGNRVELSWGPVADATSYHVYRKNGDSTWTRLDTVAGTSTALSGLAPGTYTFAVSAQGAYESERSSEKSVTIENVVDVPETPGNLRSTGRTSQSLTLAWDAASGAVLYELQRQGPGDSDFTTVYRGDGTSYVDTDLDPNTEYSYRICSVGASQESSPPSDPIVAKTLDVSSSTRPTFTETTLVDGVVTVTWEDMGSDYVYILFKNNEPVLMYTRETSYVDTEVVRENTYRVYAYSSSQRKWSWSTQNVVSTAPVQANFVDYEFTSSGGIKLNWVDNGKSYLIFRGNTLVARYLTDPTWTDETPLEGENEYVLYVAYNDSTGRTQWTWSSSFVVDKPSTLRALSPNSFWEEYALSDPLFSE